LCTLAEIVSTQRYPKQFAPAGSRLDAASPFRLWESRVLQEKGKGGAAERHLLFRTSGILLSPSRLTVGLTTLFRPNEPLFSLTPPTFAYGGAETVRWLEHLLDEEILPAFSSYPSETFFAHPKGAFASSAAPTHCLLVKCAADRVKPRAILLSDASRRSYGQPDLDLSSFKPTWTFAADKVWFRAAQRCFFDDWFKEQVGGNRLKRRHNRIFRLSIAPQALTIEYEIGLAGSSPARALVLGANSATKARLLGQACPLDVSTKDLAPLFYSISEMDLVGRVEFSGDDDLLLLQFRTELGEYKIGVPAATLTDAGVARNSTHVKMV
jgi:hypothetical protein